MKLTVYSCLIIACFIINNVQAQSATKPDEKTSAFLKFFQSDYSKGKLDGKFENMQHYYADDIRLMTEFQKTVIGKDNVLHYHKAFAARFEVKSYTREQLEILDLGQRVAEFGFFTLNTIVKSTSKELQLKGKYITIWKRENGKLSLVTEGWNYNHQVDNGDQLRFTDVPVVDIALQAHSPINTNISFELAALNRLAEATISEHDAKIRARFYADDAIVFTQGHSIQKGRKAIDEYYEQHVKEMPVFEKLDIRNDRIDEAGEYVIEYASHIAIIRSGDFSGVFTGKDLAIWRREKNGSLKIFRHIGMYD